MTWIVSRGIVLKVTEHSVALIRGNSMNKKNRKKTWAECIPDFDKAILNADSITDIPEDAADEFLLLFEEDQQGLGIKKMCNKPVTKEG